MPVRSLDTMDRRKHDERCLSRSGKPQNRGFCDCQVWMIRDLKIEVKRLTDMLDDKDRDLRLALAKVAQQKKALEKE